MSIAQEIRELNPDTKELRKFGWVVGGVFLAIAAFVWYRQAWWFQIPLWIGAPLVVLGTVVPFVLRPVFYGWMSMAVVMGFVMTRVILTVFFFVVLTPVGLVFKVIGRDALHRKPNRGGATYWIKKEYPIADRTRYEKYF